jgi:hypothetical protein
LDPATSGRRRLPVRHRHRPLLTTDEPPWPTLSALAWRRITAVVMQDTDISHAERGVYWALKRLWARYKGRLHPGYQRIANEARVARSTVGLALPRLEALGVLVICNRPGHAAGAGENGGRINRRGTNCYLWRDPGRATRVPEMRPPARSSDGRSVGVAMQHRTEQQGEQQAEPEAEPTPPPAPVRLSGLERALANMRALMVARLGDWGQPGVPTEDPPWWPEWEAGSPG